MAIEEHALRIAIDSRMAQRGAAQYDEAGRRISRSSRDASASVDKLERNIRSAGSAATLVKGAIGGLFAGIGAVTAIRSAIQTISSFEQTMATISGVTRATASEFDALSETARRMGATTRFSATEAGEGELFLARAGFEVKQVIDALPATLNLAAAANIGLGESADIASNVLTAFRLEATETERVVDAMLNTTNRSNTNIRQLAEAMKFAAPIAGALKIAVEETSASIGVLGDAGIQASLAGTGLRKILLSLVAPTTEAEQTIAALNIAIEDLDPTTHTLVEIFDRLNEAQLSVEDSARIFGARAAGVAVQLAENVDKIRELTEENRNAAGEAERMARIMDDTLAGAFRNLKSAIGEAFLQLGDAGFGGALRDTTDFMTDVIRVLIGMDDQLRTSGEEARLVADAITAVSAAAGTLIGIRMAAWLLSVSRAAITTAFSMGTLNAALFANPLTLIPAAAAAAVGALVFFKDELIDIDGKAATVGETSLAVVDTVTDSVGSALSVLGEMFDFIGEAADAMAKKIDDLLDFDVPDFDLGSKVATAIGGTGLEITRFSDFPDEQLEELKKLIGAQNIARMDRIGVQPRDFVGTRQFQVDEFRAQQNELLASGVGRDSPEIRKLQAQLKATEREGTLVQGFIAELTSGLARSVEADGGFDESMTGSLNRAFPTFQEHLDERTGRRIERQLEEDDRFFGPPVTSFTRTRFETPDPIVVDPLPAVGPIPTTGASAPDRFRRLEFPDDIATTDVTFGAEQTAAQYEQFFDLLVKSGEEQVKAQDRARQSIRNTIDALTAERETLGESETVRERRLQRLQLEQQFGAALGDQLGELLDLYDKEATALDVERERIALLEEAKAKQEEATSTVNEMFAALEREHEVVGLVGDARRIELELMDLRAAATAAEIGDVDALAAEYRDLAEDIVAAAEARREQQRLERSQQRARETGEGILTGIGRERELLGLSPSERRVRETVGRFEDTAGDLPPEQFQAFKNQITIEAEQLERLKELRSIADGIGEAFGRAFTDVATGARTAGQAIQELAQSIVELVIQQVIAQAISRALSNTLFAFLGGPAPTGAPGFTPATAVPAQTLGFSATGNAFDTSVVRFASGGSFESESIVNEPTFFAFRDGGQVRPGVMGEAGPEVILPLKRDASGRLGVSADVDGGRETIREVSRLSEFVANTIVDRQSDQSPSESIVIREIIRDVPGTREIIERGSDRFVERTTSDSSTVREIERHVSSMRETIDKGMSDTRMDRTTSEVSTLREIIREVAGPREAARNIDRQRFERFTTSDSSLREIDRQTSTLREVVNNMFDSSNERSTSNVFSFREMIRESLREVPDTAQQSPDRTLDFARPGDETVRQAINSARSEQLQVHAGFPEAALIHERAPLGEPNPEFTTQAISRGNDFDVYRRPELDRVSESAAPLALIREQRAIHDEPGPEVFSRFARESLGRFEDDSVDDARQRDRDDHRDDDRDRSQRPMVVTMNITTPDANSFRSSARQTIETLQRLSSR